MSVQGRWRIVETPGYDMAVPGGLHPVRARRWRVRLRLPDRLHLWRLRGRRRRVQLGGKRRNGACQRRRLGRAAAPTALSKVRSASTTATTSPSSHAGLRLLQQPARAEFPLIQAVSGMGEEVCAFDWLELSKGVGGGGFERVEGSRGMLSHMGLELGEGIFDRIEVGTVGRQVEQLGAAGLDGLLTPATLWAGRLSMTTISPGRRVGTSICSTQARKHSPSIGPSRSIGATKPREGESRRRR